MVNMEYACDHCQGLIVGSRINCNVCEDFDLCFGCYNAKKYPDRYGMTDAATRGLSVNTGHDSVVVTWPFDSQAKGNYGLTGRHP